MPNETETPPESGPKMSNEIDRVKKKIFSTFAEVAQTIGYSPLHGQIIAALLMKGKPLSLQEVARETGYSAGMVSVSLDLLEVLGIIKKKKKTADRKLYLELSGDLLETLKNAVVMKLSKSITSTLNEFQEGRKALEDVQGEEKETFLKTVETLESQITRLKNYLDVLSKTTLP